MITTITIMTTIMAIIITRIPRQIIRLARGRC
jgi:hypothetical protein